MNPDSGVLQGKYHTGLPDLKVAIADYLYRVRGMRCSAEQIIVTAGSRDSLILLHHALTSLPTPNATTAAPSAHSEVAALSWWLEDPTYPPLREVLSQQGTLSFLPIDEEGARLPPVLKTKRAKQQATNVALLTPNRQYPLGLNMNPSRRQQWLLKLQSSAENWWFIEDDYDNEFVYQGRVDVPFMQTAALHKGALDRTFFMGSFSKVLFRGLRLGFIVAPRGHLAHLNDTQRTIGFSASLPIQPAVADFMRRGGFDRHLNRMRRHYRLKHDALLTLFSEQLSEWCEWQKPHGGMHVLVELKASWLSHRKRNKWDVVIAAELAKEGIILSPLTPHFVNDNDRQGFILGFSGVSIETMKKLVDALAIWFLCAVIKA